MGLFLDESDEPDVGAGAGRKAGKGARKARPVDLATRDRTHQRTSNS